MKNKTKKKNNQIKEVRIEWSREVVDYNTVPIKKILKLSDDVNDRFDEIIDIVSSGEVWDGETNMKYTIIYSDGKTKEIDDFDSWLERQKELINYKKKVK